MSGHLVTFNISTTYDVIQLLRDATKLEWALPRWPVGAHAG